MKQILNAPGARALPVGGIKAILMVVTLYSAPTLLASPISSGDVLIVDSIEADHRKIDDLRTHFAEADFLKARRRAMSARFTRGKAISCGLVKDARQNLDSQRQELDRFLGELISDIKEQAFDNLNNSK